MARTKIFDVDGIDNEIILGDASTDLTCTPLTASLLISTDASKRLTSVSDLTSWVAGTANRVTIADDAAGGIVVSTPQDIHTGASFQIAKLGINIAPPIGGLLKLTDTTLDTTISYYGIENDHRKTAGVTDVNDVFIGLSNYMVYNQSGGVLGINYGISNIIVLLDGDIGSGGSPKFIKANFNSLDLDGGKIYGDAFGISTKIDQEVGNEITGNLFGQHIDIDSDGTVGGNVYGLYLNEGSNIDFGIYQNGSAPNLFGGSIENPKAKITSDGGFAVALTNNTGSNSVKGQLVEADDVDENSYKVADANCVDIIGIVYNAGVADGLETWIIWGGIAEVLLDAGGCVHNDRLISSATAGSADVNNAPAVAVHFQEIGHAIETVVGAGLAKVMIHLL